MLKFFLLFGNSRRQTAIQTQGSGSSHIHLHFNVKTFLFYQQRFLVYKFPQDFLYVPVKSKGFSLKKTKHQTTFNNQFPGGSPAPWTWGNPFIQYGAEGYTVGVVLNHHFSLYFESQPIQCYDWLVHIKQLTSRCSCCD